MDASAKIIDLAVIHGVTSNQIETWARNNGINVYHQGTIDAVISHNRLPDITRVILTKKKLKAFRSLASRIEYGDKGAINDAIAYFRNEFRILKSTVV